jgi:hypothetical protein
MEVGDLFPATCDHFSSTTLSNEVIALQPQDLSDERDRI